MSKPPNLEILWLSPNKPENISVGRQIIAQKLQNRGHNITLWSTTFRSFRDIINENPDIIIGTTSLGSFVGTWAKLIRRVPFVVDHIDPTSQLERSERIGLQKAGLKRKLYNLKSSTITKAVSFGESIAFRIADHVMVAYEEELCRVSQYNSSVTKTDLGVDYDCFANPDPKVINDVKTRVEKYVDTEEKILIYVGGLEPSYRIELLLNTMINLHEWHLLILGDGSLREIVEKKSTEAKNIHYMETVPYEEVPGYLYHADVGISLVDDRNTLKLLEYGAAGLPVVSIEGDAEKQFAGLVTFCSDSPDDVARAVRKRQEIGPSEELQILSKQRDWDYITDDYELALERIISRNFVENGK